MQKYPGMRVGPWQIPWAKLVYFTVAWHLFGIAAWKYYKNTDTFKEKFSNWDDLSSTQKYIMMTQGPDSVFSPSKAKVYNIHGVSKVESQESTLEEFMIPETTDKEKETVAE